MSYKIKRQRKTEEIELINEDGVTEKVITVRLDRAGIALHASKKVAEIQKLEMMAKRIKDTGELETLQTQLGEAIIDLYEIIFGEEDAKTILDFYEGNYIEMTMEINPFIQSKIMPAIRAAAQQARKAKTASYMRPLA